MPIKNLIMKKNFIKTILAVFSVFMLNCTVFGQQSNLSVSQLQLWNTTEFPSLGATFSQSLTNSTNTNMNLFLDNSETTGASLFITANNSSSDPVITYVITDNNTYSQGNYMEIKLKSLVNAATPIGNLTYTLETSLDGVNYSSLIDASKTENLAATYDYDITLKGFAANNYKYVRLKITLNGLAGINRRANITLYSIKKIASGKHHETLDANTRTPLVSPAFDIKIDEARTGYLGGLSIPIGSLVAGADRVIDSDLTNSGNMFSGISIGVGAKGGIGIKKVVGTYPVNTYLGFRISLTQVVNVDLGSGFEIVTYLGNQEQERIQGLSTILGVGALSASSQIDLGINITKPADAFQIVYTAATLSIGGVTVHYPLITRYEEGAPLACNQKSALTLPEYPLSYNYNVESGVAINVANDLGIKDLDKVFDGNANTYASIYSTVGINVASTKIINVNKALSKFKKDHYYGFEMMYPSALSLDLLGGTKLVFINEGVRVDSAIGSQLLSLSVPLVLGTGKTEIGFVAKQDFDQVQLMMEMPVGIDAIGATLIYNFIEQRFCEGPVLSCDSGNYSNQLVPITTPEFPVYIDGQLTTSDAVAEIGFEILNSNYAIDTDPNSYAEIKIPTLSAVSSTSFTIADAISTYAPDTYVEFDIEMGSVLNVDVLQDFTIQLIRDGQVLPNTYSPSLLAGVGALGGSTRSRLGIVAKDSFDAVQLTINVPVNVGLFNSLKVYGVSFQKLCKTTLNCNETVALVQGKAPVVINNERTGTQGLANVVLLSSGNVVDAHHVLDTISTNFARLTGSVVVGSTSSISVWNPIDEYPAGSNAGFMLKAGYSLLNVGLLNGLSIVTYNDGVKQETYSGANLLDLDALALNLLGTPANARYVGFKTSKPYDEIVLEMGGLLNIDLDLDGTEVYGAYVNTNGTQFVNGTLCTNILPDVNVTLKNKPVNGNLNTNDFFASVPSSLMYGDSATLNSTTTTYTATNGTGTATLVLNTDGTYEVNATDTGVYNFNIPVIIDEGIPTYSTLKVTVLDDQNDLNPVVANDDIAYVVSSPTPTATNLNVLINDAAGISERPLTITNATSANGGSTVINNGVIAYTPPANFTGVDTVYYTVVDNNPNTQTPIVGEAKVIVNVYEGQIIQNADLAVASDDYVEIQSNATVNKGASAGLLANDKYTGTNTLEIKNPGTYYIDPTNTSVGTITIAADGSYTVTPGTGMVASKSYPFVYELGVANDPAVLARGTMYIMGLTNAALPVTLVNFTAIAKDCKTVTVAWESASEANVSHYEVEYSATGNNFITVAKVAAKNEAATYQSLLEQKESRAYYRLKAVDFDGKCSYSKVAQVQLANCADALYQVLPNPSNGVYTVKGIAVAGTIQVMDVTGKLVYDVKHDNISQAVIDITAYPAGTYQLRIITANGSVSLIKLLKH